MKKSSRILAFVLTLLMVVSLLPVAALAEETAPASAAESILLPGVMDIPVIEEEPETTEPAEPETEEPEATEAPVEETPEATEQPEATEAPEATETPEETEELEAAEALTETEEAAEEEEAAEDGASDTDYLFIATDRHTNTSIIGDIIDNMESVIGVDELDYLGLGGDMVGSGENHPEYDSSEVLAEATGATSSLSAANVDIVAGIHDMNVNDDAGIVLPYQGGGAQIYEGDRYYVYGVEEYCISEDSGESVWSAQAEAFVKWATNTDGDGKDIDTSKVIIVVSHYPLHAKRDDNDGAGYWHNALNEVATGSASGTTVTRDVVFFHGHNHTVDSNEYYYAPGSSLSIAGYVSTASEAAAVAYGLMDEPEVTSYTSWDTELAEYVTASGTSATIYYTYATAGYLNQNSKATLVTITDDTITLDKYTTSGSGTAMVNVTRVETTSAPTVESLALSNATTEYTVGDELVAPTVTATYSDGSTAVIPVGGYTISGDYDMNTAGTYTLTITVDGCSAKYTFTVSELALNSLEVTGTDAYTVGDDLTLTIKGFIYSTEGTTTVEVAQDKCTITPSCSCGAKTVTELMNTVTSGTDNAYHQVTVEYGGAKGTFNFTVDKAVAHSDEDTGIVVSVSDIVSASGTVTVSETDYTSQIDGAIRSVAYDITPDEGYDLNPGNYANITFPIPDGYGEGTNVVKVYCVDTGEWFDDIDSDDSTYTVRTSHFSTWAVVELDGEEEENSVTVSSGTSGGYIYTLDTDGMDTGVGYLIVASESATALNGNSETLGSYMTVTIDGTTITVDSTDYEWFIDSSNRIYTVIGDRTYYICDSRGTFSLNTSTDNAFTWTVTVSNGVYTISGTGGRNTYYLSTTGSTTTSTTVRLYKYTGEAASDVTYTVSASDIEHIYSYDTTTDETTGETTTAVDLTQTKTVVASILGNGTALTADELTALKGTYSYAIVSDTSDIIDTDKTTDSTIYFTGNEGTATVRVYYSWTVGEGDDAVTYTIWDTITVTAKAPYYTINLHKAELTEVSITEFAEGVTYYTFDSTTNTYHEASEYVEGTTYYTTPVIQGDEITAPIALKGVEAGDTYAVWAVVKYHTSENPDGKDLGDVDDALLSWTVSDTSIATIDPTTGVLTFTGTNYGTIQVTVAYEGADGKVITDTITISVTDSLYVVPGDGTNDFPEYPNEGAVRFDKTATAVGNYSETGIAMVELSMTGVNYTTGSEIDVVLMLDITGSMHDVTDSSGNYTRVEATIAAAKAFARSIVLNEDGSYNKNRIGIYSFNSGGTYTLHALSAITDIDALEAEIDTFNDNYQTGGTPYDDGLALVQSTLAAAKTDGTGDDRQQFAVFMTDGVPTDYEYITGTTHANYSSASDIAGMLTSSDDYATRDTDYYYEYYSTEMKADGVTVYTVGLGLENTNSAWSGTATQCLNLASVLLNDISGPGGETTQPDAVGTSTLSKKDSYFFSVDDADAATEMENVFSNIVHKIMKAATNVVVEDKIGSNYTVNFSIPGYGTDNAVSSDALEGTTEFYIQVVEYTLDENNNRSGDPYVLENFTFNANGSLKSHTVDGVECSSCSHVTLTSETVTNSSGTEIAVYTVTAIDGTYFDYKSDSTGEYLTWETAELTDTELALQYFAYLDNSTGVSAADQIAAGTYYTNEYATLTYTNYNGNQVQQEFPVPQMTWNGAQVSYTFYLVNDAGQPVNRAGRVVPFSEAVYVTDVFTYSIVWNDLEQSAGLDAEYLAQNLVPDVYALYDNDATYNIHVYEDEDKSNLNNHFVIGGDVGDEYNTENSWTNASTTYVFNNKSDTTKYNTVGAYIANDGDDSTTSRTYLCKGEGTVTATFSAATGVTGDNFADGAYYTQDADGKYVYAPLFVEDTVYYEITDASYTPVTGETQWAPDDGDSTTGGTVIEGYIYYVDEKGDVYTIVTKADGTEVREGFDFSNTTVAFAVVWKPALRPDTVVIDYGLPVDIDVIATDSMAAGVVGVRVDAPSGVNTDGTYTRDEDATLTEVGLTYGSAKVKNNTMVTYTPNTMTMSTPEVFYYEADVNYYTYDSEGNATLNSPSMYSSVTVIPATTIYYEDSFVEFSDAWTTVGTETAATQALDRPGEDKYGEMNGLRQDADNMYGYDDAYTDMATYSLGSAMKVTLSNSNPSATAQFTFTGTAFDVISLTSNNTGTITVDVYAGTKAEGDALHNWIVDTYYGYSRVQSTEKPWLKYTWTCYAVTDENGETTYEWHTGEPEAVADKTPADGETTEKPEDAPGATFVTFEENYVWQTVTNSPNELYQIPVIKSETLEYGTYTVVITALYASFFDHVGDGEYDFYLDAIRIYDPAGTGTGIVSSETNTETNTTTNVTIADVYEMDSELAPDYYELRNWVLAKDEVPVLETASEVEGIAFIDTIFVDAGDEEGTGAGEIKKVADYNELGPNNELYLTPGNAVAFKLDASKTGYAVQSIQLAMKSVGNTATVKVYDASATTSDQVTAQTLKTATDLYYDITDLDGKIVVIENAGVEGANAILSITNIKMTYAESGTASQTSYNLTGDGSGTVAAAVLDDVVLDGAAGDEATEDSVFTVSAETVDTALRALCNEAVETPEEDESTDSETPETGDNTDSGEEEAPGDDETGGDAGDDNTGSEDTGDDTTDEEVDNAIQNIQQTVKKVISNIKKILAGILSRLGR